MTRRRLRGWGRSDVVTAALMVPSAIAFTGYTCLVGELGPSAAAIAFALSVWGCGRISGQ